MASLKDLRTRIASVKATQKITKAMQMVAAAKLRRAQLAAESARPYAERMDKVVSNLAGGMMGGDSQPLLSGTGKDQVHLLVVCTAERGLCGAFNSSIVRLARERINQLQAAGKTVKIMTVGKKGLEQLKRQYEKLIVEQIEFRSVKQISFNEAEQVGRRVREMFASGEFDVATIFYSRFKSVISQIPTAQQIIPLVVPEQAAGSQANASDVSYDYEPEQGELLADILPRNISVQVFRALLENAASEQGSRMSAMDNATRNAGDMIKKQTQIYNRTRQAMITKELIEIISGAEAL
jgi:F-type H+-transporting ATPase subunit gamma